jgi:hypothetical protein
MTPTVANENGWIMATVFIFGLLIAVGLFVKMFDLRRKREDEAVHLQAQISDALLREPSLFGLPVTPTAHVPLWRGTPVTVELTGEVPGEHVREAVYRLALAEAVRIRSDVQVEDRMTGGAHVRAA